MIKTLFYLLIVGIGIILSIPLTVIRIAWDQSKDNADAIAKRLTGLPTVEEMKKASKQDVKRYVSSKA